MKKLIVLMSMFFVALSIFAQDIERPSSTDYNTFSRNQLFGSYSYWDYTGTATDLLVYGTTDTIHIRYHVKKYRPYTAYVISKFDPILGADTIVYINLYGRNSTDESWTSILTDSSAAVTADATKKTISTPTSPTYTATIASIVDTLINGTNTFDLDADLTQLAYVDTSTQDTIVTEWTVTPTLDTSYVTRAAQTISLAETATLIEYSYLLVEYVLPGDDATGTGIEVKRSELKLYEH